MTMTAMMVAKGNETNGSSCHHQQNGSARGCDSWLQSLHCPYVLYMSSFVWLTMVGAMCISIEIMSQNIGQ